MISVGIDGLFQPMLEQGLTREAFNKIVPALKTAHRELMSRRGADVGFYDLPSRNDLVRMVTNEVSRLRSIAEDLVVLGIGGSSMGGQALSAALKHTADFGGHSRISTTAIYTTAYEPDDVEFMGRFWWDAGLNRGPNGAEVDHLNQIIGANLRHDA